MGCDEDDWEQVLGVNSVIISPRPETPSLRKSLADLPIARIEEIHCSASSVGKGPEGFCPDFQVCFPYSGLFVWHVSGEDVVGDANQVVFVKANESYRMSAIAAYRELILTPDVETLCEVAQMDESKLAEHPFFTQRSHLSNPRVKMLRARLHCTLACAAIVNDLEAEELILALLSAVFEDCRHPIKTPHPSTARLIRRTKELLTTELGRRISLADVAKAVGASPAYLTDVFRRVEGLPLHKYLLHLRLSRALSELPRAEDLTMLALSLGFSSHSHFSARFGLEFGVMPSEFRRQAGLKTKVAAAVRNRTSF